MTADALHALDVGRALRLAESPVADFRTLTDDLWTPTRPSCGKTHTVWWRPVASMLPRVGRLGERAPGMYALLTAVDALCIGCARERDIARRCIRRVLKVKPPHRSSVA